MRPAARGRLSGGKKMKRLSILILVVLLVTIPVFTARAAGESGSISGVVVETRTGLEGQGELLVEVQGDEDVLEGGSTKVDKVILDVSRRLVKKLSAKYLPEGWALVLEDGTATASGPETKTPVRIRLDFGDGEVPQDLDVKIMRAGLKLFKKSRVPVTPVSPAEVITELDEVLKVPPRVSPGDTVEMTPLDLEKTPPGGRWKIGDWWAEETEPVDWGLKYDYSYKDYGFELSPKVTWKIPSDWGVDPDLSYELSVKYWDKYDTLLLDYTYEGMEFVPFDSGWGDQPRITDCTGISFTERIICVCGWFPTPESQNAVLIDGKPMGPPISSSKHVLHFRLPEGVEPGYHNIYGRAEAGFPSSDVVDITVIRVAGSIDRDKLFRGESTEAHLWVEGTEDAVELLLKNHTPEIISFEGGDEQVVTTSGGSPNDVKRNVEGIKAGNFNITYRLTVADCPCAELEIDPDNPYFQPQGETFYDDAVAHYRRGRELANRAKDAAWRGDGSADELARQALEELGKSRTALQSGIEDGDIGENVTRTLTRFLDQEVAKATTVAEQPPPEESVPFEHVPSAPPEEPPVKAYLVQGAFEPVQGVWQDDPYFEDRPGKQLTEITPKQWNAELKMVAGRDILIYGTKEQDHERIRLEGMTTGTRSVKVRHRFTLVQGGKRTLIWEEIESENYVRLDGPAGEEAPFFTSLLTFNGIPTDGRFRIEPGPYIIECEIIRDTGEPTGLIASVSGTCVKTSAPRLRFVPALLYPPYSEARHDALEARARNLATESMDEIDKWYPIANGSLSATVRNGLNVTNVNDSTGKELMRWVGNGAAWALGVDVDIIKFERRNRMEVALTDYFATEAALGGGFKNLVMLGLDDFGQIEEETTGAWAPAQKLIFLKETNTVSTVAHEVIHTSNHLWSSPQMKQMFGGKDWHNFEQDHQAHGVNVKTRVLQKNKKELMGTTSETKWITQGTYWHLLNIFQDQPDPELFVVRALCARRGTDDETWEYAGELLKSYTIMGVPDLQEVSVLTPDDPRSSAGWAVVLTGRSGETLARYPFQAVWRPADTSYDRGVVSAVWRVPTDPDAAAIELHGPDGKVDEIRLSASAPTVRITSPAAGATVDPADDKLTVRWSGSDPDGDPLVYSVLYSPDGGETWRREGAEVAGSEFTIDVIGRPAKPMVKVLATDGARSGEAEVAFSFKR